MNSENTESQRMTKIMAEIQALQEVVTRFRQMRLDATEFACLKCIVTFKAGQYEGNVAKSFCCYFKGISHAFSEEIKMHKKSQIHVPRLKIKTQKMKIFLIIDIFQ